MPWYKALVSVFLILVHSIGLIHAAVPHCSSEDHPVHQHETGHQHVHEDLGDCSSVHISHGDHYDHGIVDVLSCLLHATDHHSEDCDQENCWTLPETRDASISRGLDVKLFAVLYILFSGSLESKAIEISSDEIFGYFDSPNKLNPPRRGPPSLS